jgi:hypothetical protein
MTTLKGNDLMKYLGKLKTEVGNFENPELHSQMVELIEAEEKFYNSVDENGRVMKFSGNGLFDTIALKADLETMCGSDNFKEIAESYKRGIKEFEDIEYRGVSKKEWNSVKKKYEGDLSIKKGIEFDETKDGKFELKVREEFYVKEGVDDYSKKFPVMSRDRKIRYNTVWSNLFTDVDEDFSLLKTRELIKKKNKLESIKNFLNDSKENILDDPLALVTIASGVFIGGFLEGVIKAPIILPSYIRKIRGLIDEDDNVVEGVSSPYATGMILSRIVNFFQIGIMPLAYMKLFERSSTLGWTALGLQIGTNVLSGIYELYRSNEVYR